MSSNLAPVRKQIIVQAPVERAFRVFTSRIERWWPGDYQVGPTPLTRVVMEARAGGRWYEVGDDGSESEWGRVLIWDPPRRVVLAWQLNAAWQFDSALMTEVEVSFAAMGPMETTVTLEHRHLQRLGEKSDETRAVLDSPGGWGKLLGLFAASAGAAADSLPAAAGSPR